MVLPLPPIVEGKHRHVVGGRSTGTRRRWVSLDARMAEDSGTAAVEVALLHLGSARSTEKDTRTA